MCRHSGIWLPQNFQLFLVSISTLHTVTTPPDEYAEILPYLNTRRWIRNSGHTCRGDGELEEQQEGGDLGYHLQRGDLGYHLQH